jgi:hypothetical protein
MKKKFDEDIAERNRTQKIRQRNGEEPGVHCRLDQSFGSAVWISRLDESTKGA